MTNAHPGLPEFDYIKPETLAEASDFLAKHAGQARPFLGGTDVFVRMRDGFWRERYLVDVKHFDGGHELRFDPEQGLTIGAAVSMNQVMNSPVVQTHYAVLAEACHWVASYQLRSRATITGNLCNGSPAGDTTGACLVYGGEVVVHGVSGWRKENLAHFFLGPGKTILKPGDIVTAITFPLPPEGSAGRYLKLGRNDLSDLAIVGVTALGFPQPANPSGFGFRLALASVAPVPLVAPSAEAILAAQPLNAETIAAAADAAMQAASPIDDVRGSARYRKLMVRNLTRQALTEIAANLLAQASR
jgi:carbon-monoxide dehydrogenase medium subunit